MKRINRFCILLALTSLLLTSCEDIFHQTSQTLEEIRNDLNTPEPRRIFVGGDFSYYWDNTDRQGLAALNGNGNMESFFDNWNHGLIIGSPSGTRWGVTDLSINDTHLYVGGNFQGHDYDGTYIMYDPVNASQQNYQNIQRYHLDGSLDTGYTPFSGQGNGNEIYAISLFGDSLIAGGNFPAAIYGYFDLIRFDNTGTSALSLPSIPVANELTSTIFSLEPVFDGSYIMVGGQFSSLGIESGLNNFSGINLSDLTVKSLIPANANTEIRDFAWWGENLFVIGNETALMDARLYKYIRSEDGLNFTEDPTFTTNLANHFSTDPAVYLDSLSVIAISQNGEIYIGGNFSWTDEGGFYHSQILKLRQDGLIDSTFKVSIGGQVNTIEIQKNGKVIVGGGFSSVDTVSDSNYDLRGILRLSAYGDIDWEFDHHALPGGPVYAIAIEEEPEN